MGPEIDAFLYQTKIQKFVLLLASGMSFIARENSEQNFLNFQLLCFELYADNQSESQLFSQSVNQSVK